MKEADLSKTLASSSHAILNGILLVSIKAETDLRLLVTGKVKSYANILNSLETWATIFALQNLLIMAHKKKARNRQNRKSYLIKALSISNLWRPIRIKNRPRACLSRLCLGRKGVASAPAVAPWGSSSETIQYSESRR